MEQIYIQNIKINKVRHLENINLSVGNSGRKHIILTGKNGSGKTSVLDAMATFINTVTIGRNPELLMQDTGYRWNRKQPEIMDTNGRKDPTASSRRKFAI